MNVTKITKNTKLEIFLVVFMTFFIFAGYYVGLTLILATGNVQYSRYYSVPLRILQFLIAIIYILNYKNNNIQIRSVDWCMFIFFISMAV